MGTLSASFCPQNYKFSGSLSHQLFQPNQPSQCTKTQVAKDIKWLESSDFFEVKNPTVSFNFDPVCIKKSNFAFQFKVENFVGSSTHFQMIDNRIMALIAAISSRATVKFLGKENMVISFARALSKVSYKNLGAFQEVLNRQDIYRKKEIIICGQTYKVTLPPLNNFSLQILLFLAYQMAKGIPVPDLMTLYNQLSIKRWKNKFLGALMAIAKLEIEDDSGKYYLFELSFSGKSIFSSDLSDIKRNTNLLESIHLIYKKCWM